MDRPTQSDKNRTRRHIYIDDENYAAVAAEASRKKVDNGRIIDEALEQYFDRKESKK